MVRPLFAQMRGLRSFRRRCGWLARQGPAESAIEPNLIAFAVIRTTISRISQIQRSTVEWWHVDCLMVGMAR
jgi:hypothetical protein